MKIEGIDHVHIYVKDLDEAMKFFGDLLGEKFSDYIVVKDHDIRSVISTSGIELIEATSPNSAVAKFIEKRGEGLAAISLKVPDLEEAVAEIKSRGIRVVGRTEIGQIREAQFHPKDAHGVMIELADYEVTHGAALAALASLEKE